MQRLFGQSILADSIKIICAFVLSVMPQLLKVKSKDGESVLFVGEKQITKYSIWLKLVFPFAPPQ